LHIVSRETFCEQWLDKDGSDSWLRDLAGDPAGDRANGGSGREACRAASLFVVSGQMFHVKHPEKQQHIVFIKPTNTK
jgi:hypothetical protein